ncbi:ASCH domain-containing protein [Burkholderia cenocepacia]|uniref:ASCH domain-containing protein n=1 Tax=Burkholderia cenocepacia TaxID=95486 RepID=UPI0008469630|nr:ASCH domain-containing protein [Burkholderia cenocepacia]
MKALSIQQPWAWLIAHADEYDDPKRIENRNRATRYRGPLLIHASKTFDRSGYKSVLEVRPDLESVMPPAGAMERGGVVGRVEVIDCVNQSPSRWFSGSYGWVLQHARPMPFVPYRGRLNLFEIDMNDVAVGAGDRDDDVGLDAEIVALADRGMDVDTIASRLGRPVKQIEQRLQLIRAKVLKGEYRPSLLPIECVAAESC